MSQDELAYEAEVSRSFLSQIEKGKYYVGLEIIGKLATALRSDPAEFFRKPARSHTRSHPK
jgi:transcriptional regulator with XRE-family HTH domain